MNAELKEVLNILLTVGGVLVLIISPVALGYLASWLRNRVSNEKLRELTAIVEEAVKAAEGLFPGEGNGASKKAYVMNIVRWAVDKLGVQVSDEFMAALVESAVFWLFNRDKVEGGSEPTPPALAYKGK